MKSVVILERPAVTACELGPAALVTRRAPMHGLGVHPAFDSGEVPDQPAEGESFGLRRPLHLRWRDENGDTPGALVNARELIQEGSDLWLKRLGHVINTPEALRVGGR